MSFAAAEQVVIAGGTHVGVASGGHVVINNWGKASLPQPGSAAYDRAKRSLEQHVVPDAFYDSQFNISARSCHPGTRVAVLATLKQRVTSNDPDTKSVCWLNGPAGAGKSAIVRSLGEQLEEEDLLAGSFFFFRTDARRNGPNDFVATITYQLCVSFPEMRPYVEQAIDKEPLIFERSPKKQLRTLILQPAIKAVAHGALGKEESKVLLVDGLDECGEKGQQEELVNVLFELAEKFPFKLTILIASRPERHLRAIFEEEPMQCACSVIALDDTFAPDVDIRRFLVDKFNEILRKHPLRAQLRKLIVKWPSPEAINRLVFRASGQFIYASTVIKFLSSFRANPAERLEMVLGERDPGNLEPFEQLDALYATILRSAPVDDIAEILDTLVLLAVISSHWSLEEVPLQPELVETLMCLPSGHIKLLLVDLESVVKLPDDSDTAILFYHKSFSEYLFDARRAPAFSRSSQKVYNRLMTACVQFELHHWDIDMPPEYPARVDDHPDRILTTFTRLLIVTSIHKVDKTAEMADQLRLYLKKHLAESQTTGPSKRDPVTSLTTIIAMSISVSCWIIDLPEPLPHYATALWDDYKACFQALFESTLGPSDPLVCAALICSPARSSHDLSSRLDEASVVSECFNSALQGNRWEKTYLFLGWVGNSLPISRMDHKVWTYARDITSVVYRTVWHKSVLALCIMMLKAPTAIDRSLLEETVPQDGITLSQFAQRLLIELLKVAPTDNEELNALKAAGNPFPLELGYEHGFDEALRGEEVPPWPESPKDDSMSEEGEEFYSGSSVGES